MYGEFAKNVMQAKNSFSTLYSVMTVQGVSGMEAAGKAMDAFSGKVEDTGKELRTLRDVWKDVFTGMERVTTGVTGRAVDSVGGNMLMKAMSKAQEYNLLSIAGLGAGAYTSLKYYQKNYGSGRSAGAAAPSGMMSLPADKRGFWNPAWDTPAVVEEGPMGFWEGSRSQYRRGRKWIGATSRNMRSGKWWKAQGQRGLSMAASPMGRVVGSAVGLAVTNISDTAAEKNGGYTAVTGLGSVAGMTAMGASMGGQWGALIGLVAGISTTVYKHYKLDEKAAEEKDERTKEKAYETIIKEIFGKKAAAKLTAEGMSSGYAQTLSEMDVHMTRSDMVAKMDPKDRIRRLKVIEQLFGQQREMSQLNVDTGMAQYNFATSSRLGAEARRTGMELALPNAKDALIAQRKYVEYKKQMADEAPSDDVVMQQQYLNEKRQLISMEQSYMSMRMENATLEQKSNRELIDSQLALTDARTTYLYGAGSPEKEGEMLKGTEQQIKNNIESLGRLIEETAGYSDHLTHLYEMEAKAESAKLQMVRVQKELNAQDTIIAQQKIKVDLLEVEKELQFTIFRNSVAAANVVQQQMPALLAQAEAAQAKFKAVEHLGGETARKAKLEASQAILTVAKAANKPKPIKNPTGRIAEVNLIYKF
jgi:hypothetical protein